MTQLQSLPDNYFHATITIPPPVAEPEVIERRVQLDEDMCDELGVSIPAGSTPMPATLEFQVSNGSVVDWQGVQSSKVWEEVYRTMRPGGYAWLLSLGPEAISVLYRSLRRVGFAVEEQQVVGATGASRRTCGILSAYKPFDGSYSDCARKWGTGPLNINDCSIPFEEGEGPKACVAPGWASQDAKNAEAGYRPNKYITESVRYEPGEGRFPGNLMATDNVLLQLQKHADLGAWVRKWFPELQGSPWLLVLSAYCIALSTHAEGRVLDPYGSNGFVELAAKVTERHFHIV